MRISTFQIYNVPADSIGKRSADLNNQIPHLSSGKRVLTAKDDPLASNTLSGFKEQLAKIDMYEKNIKTATSRNQMLETNLSGANEMLQRFNTLLIQANNGANSEEGMQAIAEEMAGIRSELFDLANTKDELGNYVFGGFQTSTPPFAIGSNGEVVARGDFGQRDITVGNNLKVGVSLSGIDLFMRSPNATGDFAPSYSTNTNGFSVNSAVIADPANHDTTGFANPYSYDLTFQTSAPPNGAVDQVQVVDGAGNTTVVPYVPGQPISLNGNSVEVVIDGDPAVGDQMSLQPEQKGSIFDSIDDAIAWTRNKNTATDPVQSQVDFGHLLQQINADVDHVTSQRASLGSRMQVLDRQLELNQDYALTLNESKAKIEDLDYAKAITEFEKARLTLQAAQQAFGQMKNMSLFNYI